MDKEAFECYAVLAYRRMRDLEHDENTFKAVLNGIMGEYSTIEVIKEVKSREIKGGEM